MSSYDSSNVFARVLRGELPSHPIFETDDFVAMMDVMPQSAGHCLLVPKAPCRNILDASDDVLAKALPLVARLARAVKAAMRADGVTVMQFNEASAGQTVFHLHFHVVPRYEGVALERHGGEMAPTDRLATQAEAIRNEYGRSDQSE